MQHNKRPENKPSTNEAGLFGKQGVEVNASRGERDISQQLDRETSGKSQQGAGQ